MTSSGPESAPSRARVDLGRLRRADCAVGVGTLLYLVFLALPWFTVDAFDLGSGYRSAGVSVNGFDSGVLTVAFGLLLLTSVWALLPAVADVPVPFPRSVGTVGLAAPAFVLTLIEWLTTLDLGFTLFGLLALLTSTGVLAFAVLRLLPELVDSSSLPGRLNRAVGWAGRRAARPDVT